MGTNNTDSNEPINPAMADALQRAAEQNNAKTIKQGKEDMKNSSNNKPRKKRKTHLERANDAIAALIECTTYKEAYDIVTKEGKYIESKRPDARETVNNLLAKLREDVKHDVIEDDSVKSDKPNNSGKKTMKKQENTESSNDKVGDVDKDQTKDQTKDQAKDRTGDTNETVVGEDVTEETVINVEDAFKQAENGENIEDAVIEDVVEPTEEDVVTEPTKVTSVNLPIEDFLFPSLKLDTKSDVNPDNVESDDKSNDADEIKKSKKVKKTKEVAKPSIVDFVKSDNTFVNNNSRKDTFSYIAVSLINKCSLLVSGHLTAIVHRFV